MLPPHLLRELPDWRAVIIRMNLAPAYVKIRPAWHRFMFRIGRHPLPVPHVAAVPTPAAPWPVMPEPEPAEAPPPVPASANGHGGQPGPLVKADL